MIEYVKCAVEIVSTVGFPIAVAGFVLIRMDRTMGGLTIAITKLTTFLEARNK